MKKIFIAIIFFAFLLGFLKAQSVEFYKFKADTTGAEYVPLSDATLLSETGTVTGENFGNTFFNQNESLVHVENQEARMTGIDLGFDFSFGGRIYDKFIALGQGYILLGEKESEDVYVYPMSHSQLSLVGYPRIGIAYDGKVYGASISYKKEGVTPNQVLTVEFKNIAYSQDAADDHLFSYQLKLYEEDNRIEFVFDGWTVPDDVDANWSVGIRDPVNAHFRKPEGKTWCQTEWTSSMYYWGSGTFFKEGLEYVFTLPEPCEKPTQTVEGMELISYTDYVDIDITVSSEGSSEGFMVLASENPIEGTPEARDYREGETVLGATVIAREDWDSWSIKWQDEEETVFRITHTELQGNKDYYYAVYLLNYKCSKTAFSDVVTNSVKTRTLPPSSFVLTSLSLDNLGFAVKANDQGENILLAMTTVAAVNQYNVKQFRGDFGLPETDAKVGDTLRKDDGSFGGIVIYVGEASDNISCDVELKDNTVYHFGAFSKRENALYSSTFIQEDTITEAKIPFSAGFENMIDGQAPYGWAGTEGFEVYILSDDAYVYAEMPSNASGARREAVLSLPPMDFPDTSDVVMELSYEWDDYYFDMVENDSIVFEISADGGKTYDKVNAVTVNSTSAYVREQPFKGYSGTKQALVRIRYVSYHPDAHEFSITKMNLIPLAFCDVPSSVYVTSVYGDKATVTWTPSLSEEKAWDISYSLKEEGEYAGWSEPLNTAVKPYELSGLYGKTLYGVRVRAVCGVGEVSAWSEITDFQSGLKPSFIENFDNMNVYVYSWAPEDTIVDLPDGWGYRQQLGSGQEIPDTIRPSDFSYYYGDEIAYDWKTGRFPTSGSSNAALTFKMNNFSTQIIKVPLFGLDGSGSPLFRMKMAYGNLTETGTFESVESTKENYEFYLLISTDGGNTYVLDKAVGAWKGNELAGIGGEYWFEKDFSAYTGAISLLFLAKGESEEEPAQNHILYIDSLSVLNQCAVARLLQVRDITQTSAELLWEKDLMVGEWIVKIEDGVQTKFMTATTAGFTLTELTPSTTYTASVAHLCGEDTSDWRKVEFTTGGEACDPITDVTVTEITRQSARLTWEGSASDYRIRLRPVSDEPGAWTYFTVEDANTFVLQPLSKLTRYEGGVQSICGMAVSDTSEYVDFEPFTTLDLTCFAPYNLIAKTIDHQSASVTWKGEADQYQVEWSPRNSSEVSGRMVVEAETGTITGLKPESNYQVRVRSICSAGDTSEWSGYAVFKTDVMPDCPAPTNLRVESVTAHSATLLWDMEEETNFFILRYRSTSVTVWDSVEDLKEKTYELTGLEPKTAYAWSVMTQCTDGRYSGWGTQNRFETEEEVSNEAAGKTDLFITTSRNQIHLMNPSAVQIDRVRIYGMEGGLLEDYVVRSNENIILTTQESMKVVIVVVECGGEFYRFKVLLP